MKRCIRHNKINRNLKTYLHGTTFMTLEQAIKHYMSDGVVNLPQPPEGSFEFPEACSPDDLRTGVESSFDRLDAASMFNKPFVKQDVPNSSNIDSSSSVEPSVSSPSDD